MVVPATIPVFGKEKQEDQAFETSLAHKKPCFRKQTAAPVMRTQTARSTWYHASAVVYCVLDTDPDSQQCSPEGLSSLPLGRRGSHSKERLNICSQLPMRQVMSRAQAV